LRMIVQMRNAPPTQEAITTTIVIVVFVSDEVSDDGAAAALALAEEVCAGAVKVEVVRFSSLFELSSLLLSELEGVAEGGAVVTAEEVVEEEDDDELWVDDDAVEDCEPVDEAADAEFVELELELDEEEIDEEDD